MSTPDESPSTHETDSTPIVKTPIKLTPLYSVAQHLGAQFAEQNHWRVPTVYTTLAAEVAVAQNGVGLVDETPNGKLTVEGAQAEAVLQTAFKLSKLEIGEGALWEGTSGSHYHIYRLRSELFFISTPPEEAPTAQKTLTTTAEAPVGGASLPRPFVTVTDITDGRSELRAIGPASRELLSKVCGLDFHPSAFPNGWAKQSSLAKTPQLIIRRDIGELPAFSIIGVRSFAAYVWETIMEAGYELGITPIGQAAVQALS